ncbi:hypothetical protein SAMN04487770_12685 [Butyrivibrio sp. ob235]|uniref:hypothetical protein n=1 Tax=Butyrivibrio sp. ob235 TaxID=1761780 RepID=UPI0008D3FCB4|nr:hypothetical protein [Butyrivibrio sp. ob235]SEM13100.1 hypothetical protein SAMN04487770_12685 [Butyrivibrio sp. ob235]
MKIYIAGPLFNEALEWCDTILLIFDGRVPDEGACFELGYAYAKGKRRFESKYLELSGDYSPHSFFTHFIKKHLRRNNKS